MIEAARFQTTTRVALAALAAFTIVTLIMPSLRLPLWIEQPNEGWNAIHAMHAFSRALYPTPPAWIINNYPPLWFYLTGALTSLFGDPIFAGRAVATVSFVATAVAIFVLLRRLAASVEAAWLGALSFVSIVAGLVGTYVGLSEPQMLAHAVMTVSLAALVGATSTRIVVGAALGVVAAMLIKPIVIALPIAGTLWLAMHRRPLAFPWIATGGIAALAAVVALLVGYGAPFIANTAFARIMTWHRLGTNLALLLKPAVPLVGFALVAFRRGALSDSACAFAGFAIGAALLEILLFGGALGVSTNIVFDLVIASSIGLGLTYDRLANVADGARWRIALITASIVRVAFGMPNLVTAMSASARADLQAQQTAVEQVVTQLRPLNGPVACEALAACAWAGHATEADLWKLRFETTLGSLDKIALLDAVKVGRFSAVVTFGDLTSDAADRNLPGLYAALGAWYEPPLKAGTSFLIFLRKPR